MENGRFIAVIGGSGSGKSSLVLAGLQGLLADETADTGGPTWAFVDMRPGGAPITRLARALSELRACLRLENIRDWRYHDVVDPDGHKIGLLGAVYVDTRHRRARVRLGPGRDARTAPADFRTA